MAPRHDLLLGHALGRDRSLRDLGACVLDQRGLPDPRTELVDEAAPRDHVVTTPERARSTHAQALGRVDLFQHAPGGLPGRQRVILRAVGADSGDPEVRQDVREAVALDPQRRTGEAEGVEGFDATRREPRAVSLHRQETKVEARVVCDEDGAVEHPVDEGRDLRPAGGPREHVVGDSVDVRGGDGAPRLDERAVALRGFAVAPPHDGHLDHAVTRAGIEARRLDVHRRERHIPDARREHPSDGQARPGGAATPGGPAPSSPRRPGPRGSGS